MAKYPTGLEFDDSIEIPLIKANGGAGDPFGSDLEDKPLVKSSPARARLEEHFAKMADFVKRHPGTAQARSMEIAIKEGRAWLEHFDKTMAKLR